MTKGRPIGDANCERRPFPGRETGETVAWARLAPQRVWSSPWRLAMSFQYLRIMGRKDVLQGHSFQMRSTCFSDIPSASATIQQPAGSPLGRMPTWSRISMVNCIWMSRANWAGMAGRPRGMRFLAGGFRRPSSTPRRHSSSGPVISSPRLTNSSQMRLSALK